MSKIISYDEAAREKLLSGASIIAKAVRVTLGPSGKTVLIRRKGEKFPIATKDGVTVASEVESSDIFEQQAIESIQQVASNADYESGDGTTTATILTEAIFKLGSELQDKEVNFIDLKRGIDVATHSIVNRLKEISKPCDDLIELEKVALISSNNDLEISKIVVEAYDVAGKQGVVNIKRSNTNETYITTISGMNLPTGYRSIYFITDIENQLVELDNPYIYMTDEKITTVTDNLNSLLKICSVEDHSLLIVCKEMDPAILGMLAENRQKGNLKVCVCIAPSFGEEQKDILKDLGLVLGKHPFIDKEGVQFNDLKVGFIEKEINGEIDSRYPNPDDILNFLPRSEAVMVNKDRLSIKGPVDVTDEENEAIKKSAEGRANKLSDSLKNVRDQYEKGLLQTRISRLRDGIAYINIGAVSDIEYGEKQDRIKDALYAVKSAAEEGIIPGGGTALLFLSQEEFETPKSYSVELGMQIVYQSIREPFNQILKNVGYNVGPKNLSLIESNLGYGIDARRQEFCVDMIEQGIIDPVKVTRVALENAASVAGTLLTTDCIIVDDEVYEKQTQNYGI